MKNQIFLNELAWTLAILTFGCDLEIGEPDLSSSVLLNVETFTPIEFRASAIEFRTGS